MICTKCHIEKDVSEFSKNKTTKTGYQYHCKKCMIEYNRTKIGLVKLIYNSQKGNSKQRGHELPEYDVDWLIKFILDHKKFNKLYKNWVKSGYTKDLVPSIDRIDDEKGYTKKNIRLTTWRKNNMKQRKIERIPVNQFGLNGKFIRSYKSSCHAERDLGIDNLNGGISLCLSGKSNQAGFSQWRLKKDGKANIQPCEKARNTKATTIDYYFGGVFYDTYNSAGKLAKHIGISNTTISKAIKDKTFKHHEHEFRSLGYYEKQNGIK